jgi:hypothetical protein
MAGKKEEEEMPRLVSRGARARRARWSKRGRVTCGATPGAGEPLPDASPLHLQHRKRSLNSGAVTSRIIARL